MRPPRLAPFCVLSMLTLCALPARSAPSQPSNLRSDILYTSKGEFVQVSPMRPLTLNAHVQQFAYEPLGVEVAFVGSEAQGDQTVYFVKTLDTRNGHEISRLTVTAPTGGGSAGFRLLGWTPSGKYLLLQRFSPDPQNPAEAVGEYVRWGLSANPPVVRPIDPAAYLSAQTQVTPGYGRPIPSPGRRWIVFQQSYHVADADDKLGPRQNASVLYDSERDTYRLLALPVGSSYYRWSDDDHLRIRLKDAEQSFDVVTGQVGPTGAAPAEDAPPASKQYPDLTVDVEHRLQEDVKGSGGHLDSCLLWVRRTPAGKLPLGAAAAGLTPDRDDPQAVWSPTGKQIAFLAHGDLYVTDLSAATDLLPKEKMAVGLSLTCAEERQLAETNMMQIGLALTQYAQDFDGHYPPRDGLNAAIRPYLKPGTEYQVGSHQFMYQLPERASLTKIESPANTVQGTIDLPCARVVLFVDGHVKSFPKTDVSP